MIIKSFSLKEHDINLKKIILLYGKNEGHKDEIISLLTKNEQNKFFYEEKEIIENYENFLESLNSRSLFESKKIIIIKRATDKILKVINEIKKNDLDEIKIIVNAENLDKRSKLRNYFEKDNNLICVPFYPDNEQTSFKIADDFIKKNKILISSSNINLIIKKCGNDRIGLLDALTKIKYFVKTGKKLNSENISKLINLFENHSVSNLVDSCLTKNIKKTENILNENNFTSEDSILILRTFLSKTKKILKLSEEFRINNDIELTLSSARPPIFWKDKQVTKEQLLKWNYKKLKKLIYKINELELVIKKNINQSIYLINNFIFELISSKN